MTSSNNAEDTLKNRAVWSSKSLASERKHLFFYTFLRHAGVAPARVLLFFIVLVYTLRPGVAGRSLPYLARRFGQASLFRRWRQVWRLYSTFGNVLLDRAITGFTGASGIVSRPGDAARMLSLLAEGNGLIVMSAHVGLWQIAASAFPRGFIVNLSMFRGEGDVDRHFFEHNGGGWADIRLIDMNGRFGGLIEMSAALKRGEALCLMGDRLGAADRRKVTVNFLGGKVRFPAYPYILSSRFGAPILLVFVRRTGHMAGEAVGEVIIRVPPDVGYSDEALRPYAQVYADALDNFVQKHPEQFFNFYDMWSN